MKVIQIPRRFVREAWGGTETVVLETSRRLLAAGIETEIVCPNAMASCDYERIGGIPVRRTPYFYPYFGLKPGAIDQLDRKGGNLFSFSLMRLLKNEPGLDLIHLHTGKRLGAIGRHVARCRKIPYVVTVHGGVIDIPEEEAATYTKPTQGAFEWGKLLGFRYGSRRVFDDAGAIICVDQDEMVKMRDHYPNVRVEFFPNGVDPSQFDRGDRTGFRLAHNIPEDEPLLLQVSRIDHQKNQLLAIDILRKLVDDRGKGHLILVGPITNEVYFQKVKKAIDDSGLTGRVIFESYAPGDHRLVDAYHAADCFLLPSLHEPFGIVILEAWATGVPVVATEVGGIPSFTENGKDILRFPSGDAEAGFKQVREILDNRPLAGRLVEAGHYKAQNEYHWDRITQRLIDLYQDLIRDSKNRKKAR